MKRVRSSLVLLGAMVLLLTPAPSASAAGPPGSTTDAQRAVVAQLDAIRAPLAGYALINGDQTVVDGYGGATADTPFLIGSVSKSFTAVLTMQLVDEGRVALDEPVRTYLDWFTTADPAAVITVRQLLNQTSGLSTLDGNKDLFEPAPSIEAAARSIVRFTPTSRPGERFQYSNLNYDALGALIERMAGMPYADAVKTRIFQPLGMARSYTSLADARAAGLATGSVQFFGLSLPRTEPESPGSLASGYLIASPRDMANYLRFQLGAGPKLLSPEAMATLHRGVGEVAPGVTYAMGWNVDTTAGTTHLEHGGDTLTYQTGVTLLPGSGQAVAVLVARQGPYTGGGSVAAAGVSALSGATPEIDGSFSTFLTVLLAIVAGLVLVIVVSTIRRVRRAKRRRAGVAARPSAAGSIIMIVLGALFGALVVTYMNMSFGGVLPGVQFLAWDGIDLLVIAIAVPLVPLALGVISLVERRTAAMRTRLG